MKVKIKEREREVDPPFPPSLEVIREKGKARLLNSPTHGLEEVSHHLLRKAYLHVPRLLRSIIRDNLDNEVMGGVAGPGDDMT